MTGEDDSCLYLRLSGHALRDANHQYFMLRTGPRAVYETRWKKWQWFKRHYPMPDLDHVYREIMREYQEAEDA